MNNIETALKMFKIAMGVTHNQRDEYFRSMLSAAAAELDGRGVTLEDDNIEDEMLLCDYCEFNYRNRGENKQMPLNLEIRIRNKKAKGRAAHES